jgi:hypothetical protein
LIMSGTDNSKRKLGTKPALEPEAELSEWENAPYLLSDKKVGGVPHS